MGRTKQSKHLNGRTKTTFTVNFEDANSILEQIAPLMQNDRIKSEIIKLGIGIVDQINEDDIVEGGIEQATKLIQTLSSSKQDPVDVIFLLKTFGSFFSYLDIDQQVILYKILGEQLNTPLQEQSNNSPKMESIDLSQLINSSSKDLYDSDPRLKVFIEKAMKTARTEVMIGLAKRGFVSSRTEQKLCYVARDLFKVPRLHKTFVMLLCVPFHKIKTPGFTLSDLPGTITHHLLSTTDSLFAKLSPSAARLS